jgi:hypothetical protein
VASAPKSARAVAEERGRDPCWSLPWYEMGEGRTYCTSCGTEVDHTWRFCAACAAPIATGTHDGPRTGDGDLVPTTGVPSAVSTAARPAVVAAPATTSTGGDVEHGAVGERYRWLWWAAGALALIAAGLTFAALVPEYYDGGESLSDATANLWHNLPAVIVWALSAILLFIPRTRIVGAGLVTASALVWAGAYLSDIGTLLAGDEDAGAGAVLGLFGITIALVAAGVAVVLLLATGGRRSPVRGGTWWALLAAVIGITYAIGFAMNWTETTVRATTPDYTFNATGTAEVSERCCTLADSRGWDLAGDLHLIIVSVLVLLVAAAWRPGWAGFGALVGAGAVMAAFPLSGLINASETRTAEDLGFPSRQITEAGLTVERTSLIGLWVTIIAAAAVLILAAVRALDSTADA